ncbi:MAG: 4'-phosphopantetheinyl transferase superfamily protein [Mucinivorans sp.]
MIRLVDCEPWQRAEIESQLSRQIHPAARVDHRPSGAPYLATDGGEPLGVYISISHTANYLAFADSDSSCGVDIELLSRRADHLATRFASPHELDLARAIFPTNASLFVWCIKEALYKKYDRNGVDCVRDFSLTGAVASGVVEARAFGERVQLEWCVIEKADKILQINTI